MPRLQSQKLAAIGFSALAVSVLAVAVWLALPWALCLNDVYIYGALVLLCAVIVGLFSGS
jgi:hypothetical protein